LISVPSNQALGKVGVNDPTRVLFIDDSLTNARAAKSLGWGSCVWFHETGEEVMEGGRIVERENEATGPQNQVPGVDAVVQDLEQLRSVWPHIFKPIR